MGASTSREQRGKSKMNDSDSEDIEEGSNNGAILRSIKGSTSDSPHNIFKIPEFLTRNEQNSYGYKPIIVSIGPYHNGEPQLSWMEGLKKEFQNEFNNKENIVSAVKDKIKEIKKHYFDFRDHEDLASDHEDLATMMVLDGCFILALFSEKVMEHNPIKNMQWVLPYIQRDLLLLENQIPLSVLETILEKSKYFPTTELKTKAWEFFQPSFKIIKNNLENSYQAKHLLDLFHRIFIHSQTNNVRKSKLSKDEFLKLKLSARDLRKRGVEFELKENVNTFLEIAFDGGVIHIPKLIFDDFFSVFLSNCIAFEQFCAPTIAAATTPTATTTTTTATTTTSAHVTNYISFMECLVNNKKDASYLVEKGIIQNHFGTDDEVSQFFKRVLKDYTVDVENSYLVDIIKEVDGYSSNRCVWLRATCCEYYMGSPCICFSTLAAIILLLLTAAQVVLAALAL